MNKLKQLTEVIQKAIPEIRATRRDCLCIEQRAKHWSRKYVGCPQWGGLDRQVVISSGTSYIHY